MDMGQIIKKVPIPIAGLILGLASLGNLVQSYGDVYRNIFGVISLVLLVLLLAKIVTEPKAVKEGLANPVIASIAPALSMGIMVLSTYIKPYVSSLAYGIWIVGLVLHAVLIVYFTKKHVLNFNIKNVVPGYFVVYVGIVVGSVTGPAFNQAIIGQYLFWFGFICYLVLLPVTVYRVLKIKGLPEPALPTIATFAAPGSLCLAGYMNSFQNKNMIIVGFLAALSLTMLVAVLLYMPKLLKLPFYPSYSAYTFPFVISGISIKLTNGFLTSSGNEIDMLKFVVKFEELLSVIFVLYVLFKYVQFLLPSPKAATVKA